MALRTLWAVWIRLERLEHIPLETDNIVGPLRIYKAFAVSLCLSTARATRFWYGSLMSLGSPAGGVMLQTLQRKPTNHQNCEKYIAHGATFIYCLDSELKISVLGVVPSTANKEIVLVSLRYVHILSYIQVWEDCASKFISCLQTPGMHQKEGQDKPIIFMPIDSWWDSNWNDWMDTVWVQ